MSSMEEQAGLPSKPQRSSADALAELLEKLSNILRPVADDARRMDASLEAAHSLVDKIWQAVFGEGGAMDPSRYTDNYDALKAEREAENDMHEVYSYGLERFQKREGQNLGVAESDSDKLALVKRRREYIAKLQRFQKEASKIGDYLRERSSQP